MKKLTSANLADTMTRWLKSTTAPALFTFAALMAASLASGCAAHAESGGGSGDSAMCEHTAAGMATPVEIVLRNMGSTDLGYPSRCNRAWVIAAPNGPQAPSTWDTPLCDEVSAACQYDCGPEIYTPVPAGTDAKFTWDGVLYELVNGCPVADLGTPCLPYCYRRVDAPPGTYTLIAQLAQFVPPVQTMITKTVELMYPAQTKIEIVFP